MAHARPTYEILVVDDNASIRDVARRVIAGLGHRVTEAASGEACLTLMAEHRFDLVFMDCQMPGLDGYETTARLRGRELEGQRVPIVAVTALRGASVRRLCTEAGMDGFVAKPFRREDIEGAILVHVSSAAAPCLGDASLLDQGTIGDLLALGNDGPESAFQEIMRVFLEESVVQVRAVSSAIEACDVPAVAAAAHRLKSGAGSVGARALSGLAKELEDQSRGGRLPDPSVSARLKDVAERSRDAISVLMRG